MKFHLLLAGMVVFATTACNYQQQENRQEEDHGHEHEKIQYTAYTESYELFAEADPFIVGEPANILAHFSDIPSFSPVDSGTVTVVLSIGENEIHQTLEEPTRTGIYSFSLIPAKAGTGTLNFQTSTEKITVPGVKVFSSHQESHEQASYNELSMVNKIAFTKEQTWKTEFKTEQVIQQPFGQVIKTVAKVQPATGNEKVIAAGTGGIILYSDNNLVEGREIVQGQMLFKISSGSMSENNLELRINEARNNFENAQAGYLRKKELAVDRIVSEKELLEARTVFENSRAVYENLVNNFSDGGQSISSPLTGFLKQVFVKNGQYVEAGQTLATVSQDQSLILNAFVQQQYSGLLTGISSANIRTTENNNIYTFEELNGKVLSFGKAVNNDSYLIPVSFQIDNKAGFIQGSLVEVYLKAVTNPQAITVPNTALLEEQGLFFVFVQETPELFEKRQVTTGATDGIQTEITAGLQPGERIVSRGAIHLKLAQASGALDPHSGHVH